MYAHTYLCETYQRSQGYMCVYVFIYAYLNVLHLYLDIEFDRFACVFTCACDMYQVFIMQYVCIKIYTQTQMQ